MNNQKKIKLLLAFTLLIIVTLLSVVVFQLVDIVKTKKYRSLQEEKIKQLEQQLDYYQNKNPDNDYEIVQ